MKFVTIASFAASSILLSACATGVPGSARRICHDTGLQPGTPEFSRCWKGVRNQQLTQDWNMVRDPLAAAAVVGLTVAAAKNWGEANAYSQAADARLNGRLAPSSSVSSAPQLCANGQYVAGTCAIAPNGSFVGGQPRIAPDGTYVAGTPRLTPNGSYVGGEGSIKLCPDGSYVSGAYCRLMPNGQYVGQN